MLEISTIFGVMDRFDRLDKMLPSWESCKHIKEFILIDWTSKKEVYHTKVIQNHIEKYNNIKIIRVENEINYHWSKVYNLAFQYTNPNFKILMKLDVDYINLSDEWLNKINQNILNKELNNFLICAYGSYAKALAGFLLINKKDFLNLNGYREDLDEYWGYEDEDIMKRAKKINLSKIEFKDINKYIYHIPHSDEMRIENSKNKIFDYKINKRLCEKNISFKNESKYKTIFESKNYIKLKRI
jgi:hypothetical protein